MVYRYKCIARFRSRRSLADIAQAVCWFSLSLGLSVSLSVHWNEYTTADTHGPRRVPQREHVRVSETGVFPLLDRVCGTLCLSHYVTLTSFSLVQFKRLLKTFWFV